jgi:hypothetical protein
LIDKQKKIAASETAVLVGLVTKDQNEAQVKEYLAELAFLALADLMPEALLLLFFLRNERPFGRTSACK